MTLLRSSLALALSLATTAAFADPPNDDHFEATIGFVATGQNHAATGFVADGAGPALAQTFRAAPYDGLAGLGLRYDLRGVISHVRMTVGFDLPFTALGDVPARRADEHDVAPRSLSMWSVRFGLGGEYRFGDVVPFVDLQGSAQRVFTTVVVDGHPHDYSATRFGFSARAGLRVHLRKWFFVTASGEYGLVGATVWAADLGVGFRIGS